MGLDAIYCREGRERLIRKERWREKGEERGKGWKGHPSRCKYSRHESHDEQNKEKEAGKERSRNSCCSGCKCDNEKCVYVISLHPLVSTETSNFSEMLGR